MAGKKPGNGNGRTRVLSGHNQSLPVRLSREELEDRAQQLAAAVQDADGEESRQKGAKAEMKAKLDELIARQARLAGVVARGEEYRDVRVEIVADYDENIARTVRTDTGECLGQRPLEDSERQSPLSF